MTTTTGESTDLVSYPAPGGWADRISVAAQLEQDHPQDHTKGRWLMNFTGTAFEFTWVQA